MHTVVPFGLRKRQGGLQFQLHAHAGLGSPGREPFEYSVSELSAPHIAQPNSRGPQMPNISRRQTFRYCERIAVAHVSLFDFVLRL